MENATDIGKLFKSELIFTWVLKIIQNLRMPISVLNHTINPRNLRNRFFICFDDKIYDFMSRWSDSFILFKGDNNVKFNVFF